MVIVSMKELLIDAEKNGSAVGAFSVGNMEMVMGVIKAAEETETPVIQQPKTYVVKKGDTLETISRKQYGDVAHVQAICELNGLEDGNLIFIGQKLLLP
mgnify:CR=1 FL=1